MPAMGKENIKISLRFGVVKTLVTILWYDETVRRETERN